MEMFSGVGMPTAVPVDNNMPTPLAPMQGMGMQAQPMGMQAQPMGMQAQPMGMHAQPMGMHAQPMGMQAQPMGMQAQPMGMQAQPMDMQAQPMAMQAQPMAMQAQPMDMQAQPMGMAAPMGLAEPMAQAAPSFCGNCGNDIRGVNFCNRCGTQVPMGESATTVINNVTTQSTTNVTNVTQADTVRTSFSYTHMHDAVPSTRNHHLAVCCACSQACSHTLPMHSWDVCQVKYDLKARPSHTSHRIASHRIASCHIASHRIASHRIASHRITSQVKYDLKAAEIAGAAKIIAKGVVTQVTGKEEYKFGDITQAVARKAGGEMSGVVNNAFAKAGGEMSGVVNNAFSSFGPVGNLFGGKKRR